VRRGRSGWQGRGWGQGGEMVQALYAHMNNKTIKKEENVKKKQKKK
jgi:murein DD-endopeptidase MepM/ murein hydrolase activator NlpD